MIAYLDASVVLRVLLGEPNPTELWGKWQKAYSSSLWRVEALRTVDRLRLIQDITDIEVADLVRDVHTVHATLEIYPLSDRILQRASESFPTVVGTLDAIHLASAIFIREAQPIDLFLTHDTQLGTAARSLGFRIAGTD
jgi:predicted nucleic acid-binding protein